MYLWFNKVLCKLDRSIKSMSHTKTQDCGQCSGSLAGQITTAPVLLFESKPIRSLLYESLWSPLCASTRKLLLDHQFGVWRLHIEAIFDNSWESRNLLLCDELCCASASCKVYIIQWDVACGKLLQRSRPIFNLIQIYQRNQDISNKEGQNSPGFSPSAVWDLGPRCALCIVFQDSVRPRDPPVPNKCLSMSGLDPKIQFFGDLRPSVFDIDFPPSWMDFGPQLGPMLGAFCLYFLS